MSFYDTDLMNHILLLLAETIITKLSSPVFVLKLQMKVNKGQAHSSVADREENM